MGEAGGTASFEDLLRQGAGQLQQAKAFLAEQIFAEFVALPWFAGLDTVTRTRVAQVLDHQLGVFLEQLPRGREARPDLDFVTLPPDVPGQVSPEMGMILLKHATRVLVDLCTDVVDEHLRATVRTAADSFLRESAFELAVIQARIAEHRQASQARRHHQLVAGLMAGDPVERIRPLAAGLLPLDGPVDVVGLAVRESPTRVIASLQWAARRNETAVVTTVGRNGVLAVAPAPSDWLVQHARRSGVQVLVTAPQCLGVFQAGPTLLDVASSLDVAPGPSGPAQVFSTEELLPERAMNGDDRAKQHLVDLCLGPLCEAGAELVGTVEAILRADGVLRDAARQLPAHTNTVRHRLSRIIALTGRDPRRYRHALEFQLALVHRQNLTARTG